MAQVVHRSPAVSERAHPRRTLALVIDFVFDRLQATVWSSVVAAARAQGVGLRVCIARVGANGLMTLNAMAELGRTGVTRMLAGVRGQPVPPLELLP